MSDGTPKRYSAGQWLDDYCRQCKLSRKHTVLAASPDGEPIRVSCDYCDAHHNYRHNREPGASARPRGASSIGSGTGSGMGPGSRSSQGSGQFPLVSEREKSMPELSQGSSEDLELLLRRIIREETGLTAATPADKWRGGELVLRPGSEGVQEKSWPIETFFHKVVMVRNRLRTLEQQINSSDLPDATKVKIQGYITGCYGSLTSFNILFADDDDRF